MFWAVLVQKMGHRLCYNILFWNWVWFSRKPWFCKHFHFFVRLFHLQIKERERQVLIFIVIRQSLPVPQYSHVGNQSTGNENGYHVDGKWCILIWSEFGELVSALLLKNPRNVSLDFTRMDSLDFTLHCNFSYTYIHLKLYASFDYCKILVTMYFNMHIVTIVLQWHLNHLKLLFSFCSMFVTIWRICMT